MNTLSFSFQYTPNTAMKVFSQLFVGISGSETPDSIPLAFATPYEDNAAGRKRQETVTKWLAAQGYWVQNDGEYNRVGKSSTTRVVENVPRPGFKITDDVKRVYWGGGNVVWRVADPDGWEVEIQSSNLMAIIQSAGVQEGGLIPGKCIWGRSEGINVLLHESSTEYKNAVLEAEKLKAPKQVGKTSRQVGGIYRLVDGTAAIYLGKVHASNIAWPDSDAHTMGLIPASELSGAAEAVLCVQRYALKPSAPFEAVIGVTDGGVLMKTLSLYKKAPLVEFLQAHTLTDTDFTNEFMRGFDWRYASSSINCSRIMSVTREPIVNPRIELLPWTDAQYNQILNLSETDFDYYGPNCSWFRSNQHAVRIDDALCGDLKIAGAYVNAEKRQRGYPAKTAVLCAMPLDVTNTHLTIYTRTNDFGYAFDGQLQSQRSFRLYCYKRIIGSHRVLPLPVPDTLDAYKTWIKKLKAENALLNITLKNAS